MNKVNLIIAAMDIEVQALLDNLNNFEEIILDNNPAYQFQINDETYILIKGKIGKANTSFFIGRISQLIDIKRVFNIGTAGGVNKTLKINDVIIATRVGYHDVDVSFFGYEIGQIPGDPRYYECDLDFINSKYIDPKYSIKKGIIVSGDSFITKDNISSMNIDQELVLACEMESAAVGQACNLLNIPFVVIRSLSDLTFNDVELCFHDEDVKSSSTNSALILLELIK